MLAEACINDRAERLAWRPGHTLVSAPGSKVLLLVPGRDAVSRPWNRQASQQGGTKAVDMKLQVVVVPVEITTARAGEW